MNMDSDTNIKTENNNKSIPKPGKNVYRFYENKYPAIGEIVMVKITRITDLGVYAELLEYNNTLGLIVVGELSKKRFKNISSLVKLGKIEAATVTRVDTKNGYIDLSRRKVNPGEASKCLKRYSMSKVAHNVMDAASRRLKLPISELYEKFGYEKAREKETLYNYFLSLNNEIVEERKNGNFVEEDDEEKENIDDNEEIVYVKREDLTDEEIIKVLKLYVVKKFNISRYRVSADIEIFCMQYGGILSVKKALTMGREINKKIDVRLKRSPIFTISMTSANKENSLSTVSNAIDIIKDEILKVGGHFNIINYPQVLGEKGNMENLCNRLEEELQGDDLEDELDQSSDEC